MTTLRNKVLDFPCDSCIHQAHCIGMCWLLDNYLEHDYSCCTRRSLTELVLPPDKLQYYSDLNQANETKVSSPWELVANTIDYGDLEDIPYLTEFERAICYEIKTFKRTFRELGKFFRVSPMTIWNLFQNIKKKALDNNKLS